MWYYQIIHNTTCGMLAGFSALRGKSQNLTFSSVKSGENGVWIETLTSSPKLPVGPQKKLKENRDYFGKLNIQKKEALQEYLHKKKGHFAEILGELGIKKTPH
ncbi:hypothetical protein OAF84_00840 [Akkermansiaceae bacterium]|nr:hypothetical protein [Akkermansiaceae bacterium]